MWTPIPSSRATASASPISDAVQAWASGRCRASTPIIRSRTTIGVANAEPEPSPRKSSRSSPSNSDWTSAIATVLPLRAARFETGSRSASGWPTGVSPSAAHSASIDRPWPTSPRRTKHRESPTARANSSTATCRSASRSSSDRTFWAIDETSRSRSSASWSAEADRARSSATAASDASVRSGPSSSGENARRSWVVAMASTPITRSPETSGTKAALCAPIASATGCLISGELAVS